MNLQTIEPWFNTMIAAAMAVVLGLLVHRVGRFLVLRVTRFSVVLDSMARAIDRPTQFALPLVALQVVWHAASEELALLSGVRHVNAVLLIAALTWAGLRAVRGVSNGFIKLHPADVEDNLEARRIHTQARVLARTAQFVVLLLGLGLMLMTFPGARQVGTSILASAGVVGLVAGIAAKSVFGNLIAGLQIALSQPIRIDDVLIVNGEWGRVEEITGTYVVLKIWDERRLIIPLQWLIEHPFENWTRTSAQLIGSVFFWVDYCMPLEPLRAEAQRVCEASPLWDRRLCKLQVTESGERCMQVRLLVTARSSGDAWDLRCELRETLIGYMQREYPQFLPRLRAEVGGLASAPELAMSPVGPRAERRA
ncbi:mechanosensitive ion channel family protein [Schlegelella sp. S2-27]|uniref:Mechanosensitive ion channel family protein n=1 Tax=Caldimonas mangrovi TaxID=2944811 RepID=A0ABT0YID2_9BURK|nr:mechanosensitive ion channel domain-containing protein [Caldimonas mangrovi]MCM5678433.1 mechanosensitive ion channel family protein [Caldimonas mangrovi]